MKAKHAASFLITAAALGAVLLSGCGETQKKQSPGTGLQRPSTQTQTKTVKEPPTAVQTKKGTPKIEVISPVCDFGVVGPNKKVPCEFKFKNAGTGTLVISSIVSTCRCTVPQLEKKEYAPGESGTITATYLSSPDPVPVEKHIHIVSNDKSNPRAELTIKGRVELKVAVVPRSRRIQLFLDRENAGMVPITLTSKDDKPFAIKSFTSTASTITLDPDATAERTTHILKPKVDIDKLKQNLTGTIRIGLSHPDTRQISLSYAALPLYQVSPARLILQNAEPGKKVTRQIWIKSNYQEKVEIESITSKRGYMKVVEREPRGKSIRLTLEITPPPQATGMTRYLDDRLTIKIKGGQQLSVMLNGWYARKPL